MRFDRVYSAACAALLLFVGCASQGPPSGGPPDKTPPYVETTMPVNDSVYVGVDTRIEVVFSEEMDRPSVERSVFLSPRPSGEVEYKWRGRRLRIETEDPLAPNRTYRVSVGAESRDAYRNKLPASYEFVFSTGASIHRGRVSGRVQRTGSAPVYLLLFDLVEHPNPGPEETAPYVSQPGDDGGFAIRGLTDGRFRVFAFEDVDQDQAYDSGVERLAISVEDADIREGGAFRFRDVRLAVRDTVPPVAVSARTVDSGKIRVKMSEAVELGMEPVVTAGADALDVDGVYHDPADSTVVFLMTEAQTEGVEYEVSIRDARDPYGNVATSDTTLVVKGDGRADTRAPAVVRVQPDGTAPVRSNHPVILHFVEGMSETAIGDAWVASDSTYTPDGEWTWIQPNQAVFHPSDPWPAGTVHLQLHASRFSDRSGNLLQEAADVSFEVVDDRDLGSLTGAVSSQTSPIVIRSSGIPGDAPSETRVVSGDSVFTIGGLIPGSHVVDGFVDVDGDGGWYPGSWVPFRHAEPVMSRIDTIDIRARWETVVDSVFTDTVPLPE